MSNISLIDNKNNLFNYINDNLKPKKQEQKIYSEVMTPIFFINKMLDDLADHYYKMNKLNIFNDKNLTWYDPAAGTGNYIIVIYYKLMDGLRDIIPNEEERKKHILTNMLFMGEINKNNVLIIKKIFDINDIYKLNLYLGDTLIININNIFKKNSFDVIIGNPPYNEEMKKTGTKPLYNKFIEYYINKCNYLSFVIPSRWFGGTERLNDFRAMMLNRVDIPYIKHYNDATLIFGKTVIIKGGVNYFLIDKLYNDVCFFNQKINTLNKYDVIVDSCYYNLIDSILIYKPITNLFVNKNSGIETNAPYATVEKINDDDVKCFLSIKHGLIKYIPKDILKKKSDYKYFKVLIPRINGVKKHFKNYICSDECTYSRTYICFKVNNNEEALSLLSYVNTKLFYILLALRRNSIQITKETLKWIPLPELNKIYNDDDIYKYFNISDDNIEIVNNYFNKS